jgi:hypothetical protein
LTSKQAGRKKGTAYRGSLGSKKAKVD